MNAVVINIVLKKILSTPASFHNEGKMALDYFYIIFALFFSPLA